MEDEDPSAVAAAAAAAAPDCVKEDPATADTLCEVAVRISHAAMLINRAALVIKDLATRESPGVKIVLPSGRSFSLSKEQSSQTDGDNIQKEPSN